MSNSGYHSTHQTEGGSSSADAMRQQFIQLGMLRDSTRQNEGNNKPTDPMRERFIQLGRLRETRTVETASKPRSRRLWTKAEDEKMIDCVLDNQHMDDLDLRKLVAALFPDRSYNQCSNHLRKLREKKVLPMPTIVRIPGFKKGARSQKSGAPAERADNGASSGPQRMDTSTEH